MVEFFQNHPVLCIAWVACVIGIIVTFVQDKMLGVTAIDNQLVAFITDNQGGAIIDIRPLAEYKQGHIVGAHHLPVADITKRNFGKLESLKSKPIILVNKDGLNIMDQCKEMKKAGFTKIYVLRNGMFGWLEDKLVTVKK